MSPFCRSVLAWSTSFRSMYGSSLSHEKYGKDDIYLVSPTQNTIVLKILWIGFMMKFMLLPPMIFSL